MRRTSFFLVTIFVLLTLGSNIITPTFESPDENAHFYYIQYLWQNRALPVLTKDVAALGDPRYQSYQPPGYYLVALAFASLTPNQLNQPANLSVNPNFSQEINTLDNDNKNRYLHTSDEDFPFNNLPRAVHVARLSSVFLAVLNALALVVLAREIFGDDERRLVFLSLSLFIPGYVFISGVLNTDNAVALAGTLLIWLSIRISTEPQRRRYWIALACVSAFAVLSKITTLALLPTILIATVIGFSQSQHRRTTLLNSIVFTLIWIALTGWLFIRNFILYNDFTAVKRIYEVTGEYGIFSLPRLLSTLPWIWQTFIGRPATQNFPLPELIYQSLFILMIISLFGWVWQIRSGFKFNLVSDAKWIIITAAIGGLTAAVLYNAAGNTSGAQGRYLYPVLGGLIAIVTQGLFALIPKQFWRWASYVILIGMPTLAALTIFLWLPSAFKLPQRIIAFNPPPSFQPLDYVIADTIYLRGYTLSTQRIAPGETLHLTLYWETTRLLNENHAVFVQIIDQETRKVAQRTTLSGLGMYQPTRWKVGEIVADEIPLSIESNAVVPQVYSIIGGLLNEKTGERLPMERDDYKLGEVFIAPKQMANTLPNTAQALSTKFAEGITLRGCTFQNPKLTLYWSSAAQVTQNYKIFVHLVDVSGNVIAGIDHTPMNGKFPTLYWQAGDWIVDEVALKDQSRIAHVMVGFYTEETQQRLAIIEPKQPDDVFELPANCWR